VRSRDAASVLLAVQSTPFTSAIEIAGKKRQKRRNHMKKNPNEPTITEKSKMVGL
jgi:hypothetical protein